MDPKLFILLLSKAESVELFATPEVLPLRPPVTVIVRARNEESRITTALESLRNQKTIINHEEVPFLPDQVIVVNNASTDGTRQEIEKFFSQNPGFPGVLITEEKIGVGQALLTGVEMAETPLIASLDGDSFAEPFWLTSHMLAIQKYPRVAAWSGPISFYDGPVHHDVVYRAVRESIFSKAAAREQGWVSFANFVGWREPFLLCGEIVVKADIKHVPDDRVWALQLRNLISQTGFLLSQEYDLVWDTAIGFNPYARIKTRNWLILEKNKHYFTNVGGELTRIGEVVGTPPSAANRLANQLTPIFKYWDAFKNNLNTEI